MSTITGTTAAMSSQRTRLILGAAAIIAGAALNLGLFAQPAHADTAGAQDSASVGSISGGEGGGENATSAGKKPYFKPGKDLGLGRTTSERIKDKPLHVRKDTGHTKQDTV